MALRTILQSGLVGRVVFGPLPVVAEQPQGPPAFTAAS